MARACGVIVVQILLLDVGCSRRSASWLIEPDLITRIGKIYICREGGQKLEKAGG